MPFVRSPPVYSTSDVVYNKSVESVVELGFALLGLMRDIHRRTEEFSQGGFFFNGCADSMMSRGTMWLQASRKERWSRLKVIWRWCWRRTNPDMRCRSNEEMGGHTFKHRSKKFFEIVQSVSKSSSQFLLILVSSVVFQVSFYV